MKIKNWKTTLAGLFTGAVLIVKGWLTKDVNTITVGVGVIITGIVAADATEEAK